MPNFDASSKKDPILVKKEVLKLNLPKNHFNKKCASKFLIFNEKKNQKDYDDFHFESPILALRHKAAKLGKASRDAYNRGGWLIL